MIQIWQINAEILSMKVCTSYVTINERGPWIKLPAKATILANTGTRRYITSTHRVKQKIDITSTVQQQSVASIPWKGVCILYPDI